LSRNRESKIYEGDHFGQPEGRHRKIQLMHRSARPTRVALALNEAGVLALPYIVLRNDHMDSLATGLAVSEFAPDSIAAAEVRALWAWSKQKLIMNDGHYFETDVASTEDIKTRDDVFPSLLLA
jgi:hypothetical protein